MADRNLANDCDTNFAVNNRNTNELMTGSRHDNQQIKLAGVRLLWAILNPFSVTIRAECMLLRMLLV